MLKKLKDLFKGMSDSEVVGLFFCKKKQPKQRAVKRTKDSKTAKKSSNG